MPSAQTPPTIPLRRLAFLLGGLAMFGPFSIDPIFPAFEHIGRELHADKVAIQQTITVYLISYALMTVVHGRLSDAIGRRTAITGGWAGFTWTSLGCGRSSAVPGSAGRGEGKRRVCR